MNGQEATLIINENAQLITIISGVVIPLLVGILTKMDASSALKSICNAALSALGSVLATMQLELWDWKWFFISWASTFTVSIASYYGLWKPTTVAPKVQEATGRFGLGRAA